jgi:hypothetical protein
MARAVECLAAYDLVIGRNDAGDIAKPRAASRRLWTAAPVVPSASTRTSLVTGLEAGGDDYLLPINFVVLGNKLRSCRALTAPRTRRCRRFSRRHRNLE